jgi:sigma-B regulation protein RsbU (phosphoserine phosphatase)
MKEQAVANVEQFRDELLERRRRLEGAIRRSGSAEDLTRLLGEVDAALGRIKAGTFGVCETCRDPIERERLLVDPLIRYCIDHLTTDERRGLEADLSLASRFQAALLPKAELAGEGWEVRYHYEALGPVSGDYIDLLRPSSRPDGFILLFGDVSGKGVAASMLMANLHALFRALVDVGLPLAELVQRANRLFCESVTSSSFATLVCARAGADGEVEICNAGHNPPLLAGDGKVVRVEASGVPLGMFCSPSYEVRKFRMGRGDTLFLYTDGLTETRDAARREYGQERLERWLAERSRLSPAELIAASRGDLDSFRAGTPRTDDLSLMVLRRIV